MTTDDERETLREVFREVTLTMLGVFQTHTIHPSLPTNAAKGLYDVFRARLPELVKPRARGRAALRALLDELERENAVEEVVTD